jgi:hypothetical protein
MNDGFMLYCWGTTSPLWNLSINELETPASEVERDFVDLCITKAAITSRTMPTTNRITAHTGIPASPSPLEEALAEALAVGAPLGEVVDFIIWHCFPS